MGILKERFGSECAHVWDANDPNAQCMHCGFCYANRGLAEEYARRPRELAGMTFAEFQRLPPNCAVGHKLVLNAAGMCRECNPPIGPSPRGGFSREPVGWTASRVNHLKQAQVAQALHNSVDYASLEANALFADNNALRGELATLRAAHAILVRRVKCLEAERGPGIKVEASPVVTLDIDWD